MTMFQTGVLLCMGLLVIFAALVSVFFCAAFAVFTVHEIRRGSDEEPEQAETAPDDDERRRNQEMAEGYQNLMSYDIPTAHGRQSGGGA